MKCFSSLQPNFKTFNGDNAIAIKADKTFNNHLEIINALASTYVVLSFLKA